MCELKAKVGDLQSQIEQLQKDRENLTAEVQDLLSKSNDATQAKSSAENELVAAKNQLEDALKVKWFLKIVNIFGVSRIPLIKNYITGMSLGHQNQNCAFIRPGEIKLVFSTG